MRLHCLCPEARRALSARREALRVCRVPAQGSACLLRGTHWCWPLGGAGNENGQGMIGPCACTARSRQSTEGCPLPRFRACKQRQRTTGPPALVSQLTPPGDTASARASCCDPLGASVCSPFAFCAGRIHWQTVFQEPPHLSTQSERQTAQRGHRQRRAQTKRDSRATPVRPCLRDSSDAPRELRPQSRQPDAGSGSVCRPRQACVCVRICGSGGNAALRWVCTAPQHC